MTLGELQKLKDDGKIPEQLVKDVNYILDNASLIIELATIIKGLK